MTRRSSKQDNKHPLSTTRSRSSRYFIAATIVILAIGMGAIYAILQQDSTSPTEPEKTALPQATAIPPTEPPQEVDFQQQLRDWFMTVDGVKNVSSLDIDVPDNEPPLVYAEIDVIIGNNDTRIANSFMAVVNDLLGTTEYSDFVIIINDGTQAVEYARSTENTAWDETVLSTGSVSSSPQ